MNSETPSSPKSNPPSVSDPGPIGSVTGTPVPVVTDEQRRAFAVLDQWLNPPQAAVLVSQGSRANWAELDRQIEILRPLFAP